MGIESKSRGSSCLVPIIVALIAAIGSIIAAIISNPDLLDTVLGDSESECQLASRYYSEDNNQDPIYVNKLTDSTFTLEMPGAAYPWTANAECHGNSITGNVTFEGNPSANVQLVGTIAGDGSIPIRLEFVGTDRVDPHTWYPNNPR